MNQLALMLAAIPVGFAASLLGIGGGVVIIPLLTAVFGVSVKNAIATSIIVVIATSVMGGSRYLKQGITNIRLGLFLELTTTLGAIIGALVTVYAPPYALYLILSALLFYLSAAQALTSKEEAEKLAHEGFAKAVEDRIARALHLSGSYRDAAIGKTIEYKVTHTMRGLIASILAGICSGMLGIGGGVLKVPIMNQLMNVPVKVAVATSKFMIGITASAGAIIYLFSGNIEFSLVAPVALGAMLGEYAGDAVMNKFRAEKLKLAFTALLLYFAYTMLAKGLVQLGLRLPGV